MKRFKLIACFLLIFSLTFSAEESTEALDKARIAQLEQQIETQNKIIARYERLEDKVDTRISQSLDLDKEVKEAHKENLVSLEDSFQFKINWILALVSFAFTIVALISIMPVYQSWASKEILNRLREQEEKINKSRTDIDTQNKYLEIYVSDQQKRFYDQEEKIVENLKEVEELDVQVKLATLGIWNIFIRKGFDSLSILQGKAEFVENSKDVISRIMSTVELSIKHLKNEEEGIKGAVLGNLTWITSPLEKIKDSVLEESLKREYEREIIDALRDEMKTFPEEFEYILSNLEDIFLQNEDHWTDDKQEYLRKILEVH